MQTSVIDATSITNVGTSPIGAGAYAVVYRARYDGDPVVIKRMKHFEHASDVVIKAFKEEAAIFSRLNHARIVRFFGVIIEKDCLSLVLEEMTHGNLFDLYRSQPKASVQDRIQWSLDIAFDLKSMNVLMSAGVNGALRAKVTDFGSAVSQLALETQSQLEKPTLVGTTLYWRAPELRRESPQFTTATDVYSYGIILTEVISWVGPFGVPVSQLNPRHMEALHGQGRSMTPDLTEADVSQEYKTIAMNCSVDNPEVRPAFPDIVKALEGLPDIQRGIDWRGDTTLTAQFDVLATSRSNRYPSGRGTIRNNLRVDHGTTIEPTIETGAIRNNVRVDYGTMLGDDNSDEILRVEIPTITLLEKSSSAFYHIYINGSTTTTPSTPLFSSNPASTISFPNQRSPSLPVRPSKSPSSRHRIGSKVNRLHLIRPHARRAIHRISDTGDHIGKSAERVQGSR
ncbi:kinase-like domain-containing protein [Chytridium lagenaria]|nr:kinase-like domain-containing protein [Chytridium lagenaria]